MSGQAITERQSHWLKHLKAIDAGGQSTAAYARREDLKAKDLYQWKSRLTKLGFYKSGKTRSDFIAVKPSDVSVSSLPGNGLCCALVFGNGIRFEFDGSVSPAVVREVVQSVSCVD